jgi:hypothetical protein
MRRTAAVDTPGFFYSFFFRQVLYHTSMRQAKLKVLFHRVECFHSMNRPVTQ